MVYVTHHGEKRIKDRAGLSKKIADKVAEKAFEDGIKHRDCKGSLKRFLDGIYLSHKIANNIRIWNRKVYLFHDETLITVLDLPHEFVKIIDRITKKQQEKENSQKET